MKPCKVMVVGAGPTGLLTAALLKQRNFDVIVYEKNLDPTLHDFYDARSMNFTISPRGIQSLELVNAWQAIRPHCVKIAGRAVHTGSTEREQVYSPRDPDFTALYSIRRMDFIRVLTSFIRDRFDLEIVYGSSFLKFDKDASTAHIKRSSGIDLATTDFIVGADGTNSQVAKQIREFTSADVDRWDFDWKYKRFEISSAEANDLRLKNNYVHFYPARHLLVLALPNCDGSFSCNLFFKTNPDDSNTWDQFKLGFAELSNRHRILTSIIQRQFDRYPMSHIKSHLEYRWHFGNQLVVLGDAAHSVYHFYAQGLNSALEDSRLFIETLDRTDTLAGCFEQYQAIRFEDISALRTMSKDHFYFLKDRANSAIYQTERRLIEFVSWFLGEALPNTYAMVVRPEFTYSEAYQHIQRQKSIFHFLSSKTLISKKTTNYV